SAHRQNLGDLAGLGPCGRISECGPLLFKPTNYSTALIAPAKRRAKSLHGQRSWSKGRKRLAAATSNFIIDLSREPLYRAALSRTGEPSPGHKRGPNQGASR